MSRVYRIAVSESLSRIVHLEDAVQTRLELLPILPVERMAEILADNLRARGFEVQGAVATRRTDDGLVVTIDLEAGTVTVSLAERQEIVAEATGAGQSAEAARADAEVRASRQADRLTEQAQLEVTRRLEQQLRDLRAELDRAGNEVTATALEERARQLGEIEAIHRDPESGSMTIKVRL